MCAAIPLVLLGWPSVDGLSVRLLLASAVQFAFVAALSARHLTRGSTEN